MGEWSYQWKLSNVTPVYKKDDETSKSNYRPVSVISVIPKVFERIKYDQLCSAFTPIFSDNMSGFLRGHSCCSALLKLTDDWRHALDKKKDVGVVAIDLSKAFDSICHDNLLLAKLKAYGVQDSAFKLIQSYLLGRLQRVKCNGNVSDWLPFRCGVPRGSLLGPLLFNIFVNDVNYSAGFSSLRLYADDTTQYVSHECPALLESILNQDIKKLTIWFSANYLQVNSALPRRRSNPKVVGSIPTLVGVFLCPCVGPFPSVGLTLTWFIWDRNLALHITLYSVNSV